MALFQWWDLTASLAFSVLYRLYNIHLLALFPLLYRLVEFHGPWFREMCLR